MDLSRLPQISPQETPYNLVSKALLARQTCYCMYVSQGFRESKQAICSHDYCLCNLQSLLLFITVLQGKHITMETSHTSCMERAADGDS